MRWRVSKFFFTLEIFVGAPEPKGYDKSLLDDKTNKYII